MYTYNISLPLTSNSCRRSTAIPSSLIARLTAQTVWRHGQTVVAIEHGHRPCWHRVVCRGGTGALSISQVFQRFPYNL